jgi:hypothetical protein
LNRGCHSAGEIRMTSAMPNISVSLPKICGRLIMPAN